MDTSISARTVNTIAIVSEIIKFRNKLKIKHISLVAKFPKTDDVMSEDDVIVNYVLI